MNSEARRPDPRTRYVPPSIDQLAFNCPHCGALAKQFWYSVHMNRLEKDQTPVRITLDALAQLKSRPCRDDEERESHERVVAWAERVADGRPFFKTHSDYRTAQAEVYNASISRCFNCEGICVWISDAMVWPNLPHGPLPNVDLPPDVRRDYEEASNILDASPRGAAALLRLAIQKLCKELGESGENINADIRSLVAKGLPTMVQQALDVVRVVGNHAVHPGQIDLRDDRPTAEKLFGLVNLICEIMISEPKHVTALYESVVPEKDRKAIEKRDGPKPRTE